MRHWQYWELSGLSVEEVERQLFIANAEVEVARQRVEVARQRRLREAAERELAQAEHYRVAALGATEAPRVDPTVGPLAVTGEPIAHPAAIDPEPEPLAPSDELGLPAGGELPEKACDPESSARGTDGPTGVGAEAAPEDEVRARGPREPVVQSAAALSACPPPADLPSAEVTGLTGPAFVHGAPSAGTGQAGGRRPGDRTPREKSPGGQEGVAAPMETRVMARAGEPRKASRDDAPGYAESAVPPCKGARKRAPGKFARDQVKGRFPPGRAEFARAEAHHRWTDRTPFWAIRRLFRSELWLFGT